MRKPDKKETVNLFFSAFLILAFIVCAHFFTQFTANLDATLGTVINICIYAVFGLLVFYATRVGRKAFLTRYSYCDGSALTLHHDRVCRKVHAP